MDSESRNKAAQDLLEEKKNDNTVDPYLILSQCLPDPVHVGKRMSRQLSNWYLVVNGYRTNRVQLRTLRNDPHLKGLLVKHLTVAACRNRDRMDVDSMLEKIMNCKLLALGKGFWRKKLEGCSCARRRPVVFRTFHTFTCIFSRELCLVAVHGWFAIQSNVWKVLWKLFDIGFPYKHCYFKPVCLLVKIASKTVICKLALPLKWWLFLLFSFKVE